jgi:hypothetical protein
LNLAQFLKAGYHGPWWSAAEMALLGTLPEEEVAARTGRTANGVRPKRCALGIPNPRDGRTSRVIRERRGRRVPKER